ncbi:MAG: hypothetical protein J5781_01015 [Clostridia bacterium]|nr:hypothetical protein [Clostridia bacterium]
MKARKVFLWLQLLFMYALHALIWMIVKPIENIGDAKSLEIAFFVLTGLVAFFVIVNGFCAFLSVFKDHDNPTKITLVIKLAAIPWYVVNFYFWFGLASGFLNPFLLIALPLVIGLGVVLTYFVMLSTSLYSIAYLIRGLKKQMFPFRFVYVPAAVCHFIFCLDVVGAIWLRVLLKKER